MGWGRVGWVGVGSGGLGSGRVGWGDVARGGDGIGLGWDRMGMKCHGDIRAVCQACSRDDVE